MLGFMLLGVGFVCSYTAGRANGHKESYDHYQKAMDRECQHMLDVIEISDKWNKLSAKQQDDLIAELEADLKAGRFGKKKESVK